jgi:hypothetical protein
MAKHDDIILGYSSPEAFRIGFPLAWNFLAGLILSSPVAWIISSSFPEAAVTGLAFSALFSLMAVFFGRSPARCEILTLVGFVGAVAVTTLHGGHSWSLAALFAPILLCIFYAIVETLIEKP